jgi:hypothetical protein
MGEIRRLKKCSQKQKNMRTKNKQSLLEPRGYRFQVKNQSTSRAENTFHLCEIRENN